MNHRRKNTPRALMLALFCAVVGMPVAQAELKTEVVVRDGVPQFLVNGEPQTLDAIYHTLGSDPKAGYVFPNVLGKDVNPSEVLINRAVEHGFKFYTMPIPLVWLKEGEEPDYSGIDAMFQQHLALDPNALIIPRIRGDKPPTWWINENPDAELAFLVDESKGALSDSAKRDLKGYGSPASEKWKQAYYKALCHQVQHLEAQFGNHIIGYNPGSLSAVENFYPRSWDSRNIILAGADENYRQGFIAYAKAKYGNINALNNAWKTTLTSFDQIQIPALEDHRVGELGAFRDPAKQQHVIDFARYLQKPIAEYVIDSAKAIKEASNFKKVVIVFFSGPDSGHTPLNAVQRGALDYQEVLESTYIDIITNPYSYRNREHGGAGSVGNVPSSLIAHGKMYIIEDDTRSHNFPYNHFSKAADLEQSEDIFARLVPYSMQWNTGRWHLAFGSGANAQKEIFEQFERNREIRESYQAKPFRPEIAMVYDTESYYYLRGSNEISLHLSQMTAEELPLIGAPHTAYMLSDVLAGKVADSVKMLVFLNAYTMDAAQRQALHSRLKNSGKTVVWLYAPGYFADNTPAVENIGNLTGIQATLMEGQVRATFEITQAFQGLSRGFTFGVREVPPTLFAIEASQPGVTYLATYNSGGYEYGMAAKEMDGWKSILFTGVRLSSEVLRAIAQDAGVHLYTDSKDAIVASSDFVALIALSSGTKTLRFPEQVNLVDMTTGQNLAQNVNTYEFEIEKGKTLLLKTQKSQ